jgi:hypothetical protein
MILPFFGRCRRQQMAAIAKKRLRKEMSLCQILEILSVTIFEKKPILLVFSQCNDASSNLEHAIHMNLLELFWDSTVFLTRNFRFRRLLVPRASRPCPSTAKMAVARLWLRLRRAAHLTRKTIRLRLREERR